MTTTGSPAEAGVAGVSQVIPHPPGHPFPAGGQENVPPVGHGGGVQTGENRGEGDDVTATADTGMNVRKSRTQKRVQGTRVSIQAMVLTFIKEVWLPVW
jgi:hypothetical protein